MEDCLHTSSDNLAKLVKWAHSHGTICTLIPSLKHLLTEGAHGNLTALWGCSAGHAYHWPLTATCKTSQKERVCYPDSRSINAESLMQGTTGGSGSQRERFMDRSGGKGKSNCVQVGDSCDFSNCSEPSEADDNTEEYNSNLFDIVCESSATDEDGDSEPHQQQHAALRKRTAPGGGGGGGGGGGEHEAEERSGDPVLKKIKQETAEDYYTVANAQLAAGMLSEGGPSSTVVSQSPRPSSLTRPSSHSSLSHKLSSVDGDSLGVSPLPMGSSSSPHPQTMLRPMRAPTHTAQSKAPGQSSGAPAGALSLPSKSELLDRMPGDELAKSAVSYGDLGGGLNPELDLMTGQALNADSRAEASGCLGYSAQARGSAEGSMSFFYNSTNELSVQGKQQLEEFVSSIDPGTLHSLQAVIGKILTLRERAPAQHSQRVKRPRRRSLHQPHPPQPQPHPHPHPHQHQPQDSAPSLGQMWEEHPLEVVGQGGAGHGSPGPGQQELYTGCGVYLPTVRLAAMHQESRQDCMRLFHQLFEHFFSEDDLIGAVAFGKRGKVPKGKKVLDRRIVDGIITYVLRCSSLDGWTSVDSSKLKKACINKCRMRMSQRRRLGQMTFFNPEDYMMGTSDLQPSPDDF
ncbi:uncharacterized protein LOC125304614 isoform X2 [Alosa alosa]|uniref:uncharacterized protein LOC125304614 isoform X2 n=1 Tax=Alosa alosa TaxID=278164 RepID=UPI002015257A|nr:uncharacterized protein LOC125304614 isoform X2 [Alosa alosa]